MAEMPTNCYKKENIAKADSPGHRLGAEISPDWSGRVAGRPQRWSRGFGGLVPEASADRRPALLGTGWSNDRAR